MDLLLFIISIVIFLAVALLAIIAIGCLFALLYIVFVGLLVLIKKVL